VQIVARSTLPVGSADNIWKLRVVFVISFRKLLALLCLFALSDLDVQAQIGRVNSRVSGTVADSSGAPLAGAHVTTSGADGVAHSQTQTRTAVFLC
jgi:hypothetical protein